MATYRPKIKQKDGSLVDLPLDAETLAGVNLNNLFGYVEITTTPSTTILNVHENIAEKFGDGNTACIIKGAGFLSMYGLIQVRYAGGIYEVKFTSFDNLKQYNEYVSDSTTLYNFFNTYTNSNTTYQPFITEDNKLDYSLINNTPTIPTKVSELTNDKGYVIHSELEQYATQDDLTNVIEISEGKTATYVINTGSNSWFNTTEDTITIANTNALFTTSAKVVYLTDLKLGDIVLIKELDIPDRYVGVITDTDVTFYKMETSKIKLDDYALKTEIPTNYVTTNTTQTISEEKTFTKTIYANQGANIKVYVGVTFNAKDNYTYMIYGDGANPVLYTQIKDTDGNYTYKKFMDESGYLYSNNTKVDLTTYLPLSGNKAMTGDLNMGSKNIENVNMVDGNELYAMSYVKVYSDNADMQNPPTDEDIDATYYSKGIEVENADSGDVFSLYFPQKTGTIALTSDIPTKTSQLTNDSNFAVTTRSQTFTQENTFTQATYAPTWVDIASGIGKSSKFTRGAFMQLVTGQILLPNASCNDTQAGVTGGFNTEANKLKFQTMTASSGQPVVTTVAEINSNGIYQNGKKVANITDIPPMANNGYSGYLHAGSDGVAEMGKYIDFHATSTDTKDYDVRFVCPSLNSQVDVHLPSKAGTLALTSDISSSSGGGVEVGGITLTNDGAVYTFHTSDFQILDLFILYSDSDSGLEIESDSGDITNIPLLPQGVTYIHIDRQLEVCVYFNSGGEVGGMLTFELGNELSIFVEGTSGSSSEHISYRGYK